MLRHAFREYQPMSTAPKIIAVVDDEAAMRKAIVRLLSVNGFATQDYSSAEALLESNVQREACCLVLDIHLGGMSGIELQQRLSASGSRLPVIFITAVENERTYREAMSAGCVSFLHKPFPGRVLIDSIRKALHQEPYIHSI